MNRVPATPVLGVGSSHWLLVRGIDEVELALVTVFG